MYVATDPPLRLTSSVTPSPVIILFYLINYILLLFPVQSTSAPVSGRNPLLARIQLSEEEESTDDD